MSNRENQTGKMSGAAGERKGARVRTHYIVKQQLAGDKIRTATCENFDSVPDVHLEKTKCFACGKVAIGENYTCCPILQKENEAFQACLGTKYEEPHLLVGFGAPHCYS